MLERPPLTFDVVVVVGDVGVFHVHPVSNAVGKLFPLAKVLPNGLFALFNKWLDTVGFNLLFAIDAKEFFYFQLNGQTVSIPTSFAKNVFAFHHLVTWDQVLDGTCQNVTDVWFSVGCWWTIVESERTIALGLCLLEDFVLLPKLQHLLFSFDKVKTATNLCVLRHSLLSPLRVIFEIKNERV